jgi:tetratricopeptide (TPR) repeat protein
MRNLVISSSYCQPERGQFDRGDRVDEGNRSTLVQVQESLRKRPADPALLRLAERAARREGAFGLLADLLANAVLAVERHGKAALCLKLGALYRDDIGYAEEAARWYLQALEEAPSAAEPFDALLPLCDRTGQWELLVDGLLLRAGAVPEEAAQLKARAAALRLENDEDSRAAIPLFEELFSMDPGHRMAAEVLAGHYTETEQWEKLAVIFEVLLERTEDPAERADLLKKLALLRETVMGDELAAAESYKELTELLPDDLEALRKLEQLYLQQDRPDELARVLWRMVPHCRTVAEKVEQLTRIADIALRQGDSRNAAAVSLEILEHDPGNLPALDRLESLLPQTDDWEGLLEVIDRRIRLSDDADEVLSRIIEKGDICRTRLSSPGRAEEQYRLALELVPGHPEAMERMVDLYLADGRHERLLEFLLRRARHTEDEQEQARLLTRMALIARDAMQDRESAVQMLEAALQRVPDHVEAAAPLAGLYCQEGHWARALPLLELLRERAHAAGNRADEARLLARMGETLRRLGRDDDALICYRAAHDAGDAEPDVLRALGELNLAAENHDVALSYYSRYLERLAPGTVDGEALATMGRIELALGRRDAARGFLERALVASPEDPGLLNLLVELHHDGGDPAVANELRRRLADLRTDPLEKLHAFVAIGDACREQLEDTAGARAAYERARTCVPESRIPLLKLLQLHAETGETDGAAEVLEALVEVEPAPERRVHFASTLATLLDGEIGDKPRAAAAWERVLDLDPENLDALKALVTLLTDGELWAELEGAYLRMLHRLSERNRRDLEHVLTRGLGELYERHLDRPGEAIEAYRKAARLKPDDIDSLAATARLCEGAEEWEEAADAVRALIQRCSQEAGHFRRLGRLSHHLGRDDDAWFCLAVLDSRGEASAQERDWLANHRPTAPAKPLSEDDWGRELRCKAQSSELNELFALLFEVLGPSLQSPSRQEANLQRKDRVDTDDNSLFSRTLRRVAGLLALPVPEVYRSPHNPGMEIIATQPPSLVVGAAILGQADERLLAFLLARTLTWFHPWHTLANYVPADGLKFLLAAAVTYVRQGSAPPETPDRNLADVQWQLSKRLGAEGEAKLEALVGRLGSPSVSRWLSGVELTSNHAGLLASQDVKAGFAALNAAPPSRSRLPREDQLAELALYATSKEFGTLRRR